MTNYKKLLFSIMLMFINITFGGAIYAQNATGNEKTVKAAADAFYKKYLPQFGYPSAAELNTLRPLLSESLYSSLQYERKRMKIWTAKNPGEKPPVIEDLFVCNQNEPPARFRTGKITVNGQTASAAVNFDYTEDKKIYTTCRTQPSFISVKGKWLLNNIIFDEGADLKTLLSRKDYEVLP